MLWVASSFRRHPFYNLVHRLFLFGNRRHERKLVTTPVEIVRRPMDLEIVIAFEVVGQETDANLERHQFARERQMAFLSGIEHAADRRADAS